MPWRERWLRGLSFPIRELAGLPAGCRLPGGPGEVPGFPSCRRLAVQPWTGKAAARLPRGMITARVTQHHCFISHKI